MFLVHKKGFVPGSKMMGGMLPYDFFCSDDPSINLFVFTGSHGPDGVEGEQTLWAFSRLERFEAMQQSFNAAQGEASVFQRVSVLTGPSHNGSGALRFQDVAKIVKYESAEANARCKPEYEIHTREGDSYFTRPLATAGWQQRIIYEY